MSTCLFRLAQWAFHRRRLALGLWLVAAVALSVGSGGKTNDNFTIPGTESQQTADLLKAKLPALAGGQTQVVFATHGAVKVSDPGPRAGIAAAIAILAKVPQVASAGDPFTARSVSQNGQVALGQVQYRAAPADVSDATLDPVQVAVAPAGDAGVQVEYSGSVYPGWRLVPSELPEIVGLVVAFIILLITFGAFVAAGLPILTAVIGVAITLTGVRRMSHSERLRCPSSRQRASVPWAGRNGSCGLR